MNKPITEMNYGDFQEEFLFQTGHTMLGDPKLYAQYVTIRLIQEQNALMLEILNKIKDIPKEVATQINKSR